MSIRLFFSKIVRKYFSSFLKNIFICLNKNTGLELNLLQKYIFIPLDIFKRVCQNEGIKGKMEAWLTFLSSDEPEDIVWLITDYPEFKVVYDEQGLPVHMSSTYMQADNVVLTVENGNYRKELIEKQSG